MYDGLSFKVAEYVNGLRCITAFIMHHFNAWKINESTMK